MKPLNRKNYGSIPHIIGSKLGVGDYHLHEGQNNILFKKVRDQNDFIIVTEKYDGSNVGVCKVQGNIYAITRSGYLAKTSPYKQHHYFSEYVDRHKNKFNEFLNEGERLCGEWLLSIHSLPYEVNSNDPFLAFDLITANQRHLYSELMFKCGYYDIQTPRIITENNIALDFDMCVSELNRNNSYVINTPNPEGLVFRVERNNKVDFLAKFVRHDFIAGTGLFTEEKLNIDPTNII